MSSSFFTKLGNDIETSSAGTGNHVSLSNDGSILAVSDNEKVSIHQNQNGTWNQIFEVKLEGTFGYDVLPGPTGNHGVLSPSLSLSGDGSTLAVSSKTFHDLNVNNGVKSVLIYKNLSGTWTQTGTISRPYSQTASEDLESFGYELNLSFDGSVLAVGDPFDEGLKGSVSVFQDINGTWNQIGNKLTGQDTVSYSNLFGQQLQLSADGTELIIGVGKGLYHGNRDTGAIGEAKIYQNLNGTWVEIEAFLTGESPTDLVGSSVSISADGSVLAVGASLNDGSGIDSGHVRVYVKNSAGGWQPVGGDIDGESAGDYFGGRVSLSADGSVLAVSAENNSNENGIKSGHVRIYQKNNGVYTQVGNDIDGELAGDRSGWSLDLSGDGTTVAIGSRYHDLEKGHVRVYQTGINPYPKIEGPSGNIGDSQSSITLKENQTFVLDFNADESVSWSINNSLDYSKFLINSSTGALRFINAPDYEVPADLDADNSYLITIKATDTSGYESEQRLTVNISDLSDEISPLITGLSGNPGDSSSSISIKENNLVIHTLSANESVTWSLNDSLDSSSFSINASTGSLSFTSTPDYETPYDNDSNNQYLLDVRATDLAGNYSDQALTVSILDVNETPPSITGPSGAAGDTTSSKSLAENISAVYSFTANENVTWSINGGTDQNLFNIDASTGALSFKSAPNYESPSDSDSNNIYVVTVRATDDDGNTSNQTLTTTITDVRDETAPNIVGPSGSAGDAASSISIKEHSKNIFTFTANESITWSIGGGDDQNLFNIDSSTGILSFKSAPNYESPSDSDSNNLYLVTVKATDNSGNSSDQILTTTVTDTSSTEWVKIGSDINGEAALDYSGASVSLSSDGSVVAIGADSNSGNGDSSGHVRIYQNIGGLWTQIGSDINGEAALDFSGASVSLSSDGSVIAIGAELNDGNGDGSGHVRIYQNIGGLWTQIGSDINGEAALDFSGASVSLSSDGSVVAIGADFNSDNGDYSGHVRVYQNIGGSWTQIGSDIDGEAAGDRSGYSVSLSSDGSVIAIGAKHNSGNGSDSGHVRIYKNVDNTWTQIGSDIDGEAASDYSGTSVSLSADGSVIAIGALGNDENGTDSGHVRIYKNVDDTWTQIGSDIDGEAAGDWSGESVSLSADGSIVAIGAIFNDGNGNGSGHVRTYQIDLDTTIQLSELEALTYIASNPDLIDSFGINTEQAISHYNNYGKTEGRSLDSFSVEGYFANNADLVTVFANNGILALKHYIQHGYREGRTFSSSDSNSGSESGTSSSFTEIQALQYIASNADLINVFGLDTASAISHYNNFGKAEGRSLDTFSAANYLSSNVDLFLAFGSDETKALKHYIQYGYKEGRETKGSNSIAENQVAMEVGINQRSRGEILFSSQIYNLNESETLNYIASHSDLISTFGNDLEAAKSHYINYGKAEGRQLDNFDEWGYLASNKDLLNAFGKDATKAIKHYISYGKSEGRLTNVFNAESYLNSNSDLRNAFGNDLDAAKKHFVESGFNEGRVF